MKAFVVLLERERPDVVKIAKESFSDFHPFDDQIFFVAGKYLSSDIAEKLSLYKQEGEEEPGSGVVVELAAADCSGRAPATLWEWFREALEK